MAVLLSDIFQTWGLEKYTASFLAEEIDVKSFQLLSEDEFMEFGVTVEDALTMEALASSLREKQAGDALEVPTAKVSTDISPTIAGSIGGRGGGGGVGGRSGEEGGKGAAGFMILCASENSFTKALERCVFDLGGASRGRTTAAAKIGARTLLFALKPALKVKGKGSAAADVRIVGPFVPKGSAATNISSSSSQAKGSALLQIRFRDEHPLGAVNISIALSKLRLPRFSFATGELSPQHVAELLQYCKAIHSAARRSLPSATSTKSVLVPPAFPEEARSTAYDCVSIAIKTIDEELLTGRFSKLLAAEAVNIDKLGICIANDLAKAVTAQNFALAAVLQRQLAAIKKRSGKGDAATTHRTEAERDRLKYAEDVRQKAEAERKLLQAAESARQKEKAAALKAEAEKRRVAAAEAVAREQAKQQAKQQAEEEEEEAKRSARRDEREHAKAARRKELEMAEDARREEQKKARADQKAAQLEASQRLKAEEAQRLVETRERAAAERAGIEAFRQEAQAFQSKIAQKRPSVVQAIVSTAATEGPSKKAPVKDSPLSSLPPPETVEAEDIPVEQSMPEDNDAPVVIPESIKRFVATTEQADDAPLLTIKARKPRPDPTEALYELTKTVTFYEVNETANPIHGGRDFDLCHEDLGLMTGLSDDSGLTEEKDIGGSGAANEVDLSNYAGDMGQAGAAVAEVAEVPLFKPADVAKARAALLQQLLSSSVVFESVELSRSVLQWVQSTTVEKKSRFIRCLEQIAEDPPVALHLLPGLASQKHTPPNYPVRKAPVLEGKLDILWQQRPSDLVRGSHSAIIVFYIVKPDKVLGAADLIYTSYQRMKSHDDMHNRGGDAGPGSGGHIPEVFLNPTGSSPIAFFELPLVRVYDLLAPSCYLPMRLTNEELVIIKEGKIILGRSGTGKTNCIVENMRRTFLEHVASGNLAPRQAFVARSRALCNQVKRMFVKGVAAAGVPHKASFLTIEEAVVALEESAFQGAASAAAAPGLHETKWQPRLQTRFADFDALFQSGAKPKRSAGVDPRDADNLDPIDVWKQIRSVIKGGPLVAWDNGGTRAPGTPLTLSEYLGLSESATPLTPKSRKLVYSVFEAYGRVCTAQGLWDDTDRVLGVLVSLQQPGELPFGGVAPFDFISLDEVQDATAAEISLLLLAAGADSSRLFLAGDTAQTIQVGSNFRFEDVRSVLYQCNPQFKISKVSILTKNYRSHSGILQLAALPLDGLNACFPESNAVVEADFGLAHGTRPGITLAADYKQLALLLARDRKLVVVTRDEHVLTLLKICDNAVAQRIAELEKRGAALGSEETELNELRAAEFTIMGVKDVKGLEFEDVALVDFFGQAPEAVVGAWIKLFDIDEVDGVASKKARQEQASVLQFPLSFEAELKELYVAFTRPRAKLFLVELHPNAKARNAKLVSRFTRALVERELAGISEILPRAMLPEEWLQRGLLFCIAATSDDPSVARPNLNRAIRAFEKGGSMCEDFGRRALCLLQYWTDRETVLSNSSSSSSRSSNKSGKSGKTSKSVARAQAEVALSIACDSAAELFEAGLLREASGILGLLDLAKVSSQSAASVVELQGRIMLLSNKYNENTTSYNSASTLVRDLRKRAKAGDVEAILALVPLFEKGTLQFEKDPQKCLALVERAKNLGSCEAHFLHAVLHVESRCGLELDDIRAASEMEARLRSEAGETRVEWAHERERARCELLILGQTTPPSSEAKSLRYDMKTWVTRLESTEACLKEASAELIRVRKSFLKVTFLCAKALRISSWAKERHANFFTAKTLANKPHAEEIWIKLSNEVNQCTLPRLVACLSVVHMRPSFESWKRQGRTAVLTKMARNSSLQTLQRALIRLKNVAAAHRKATLPTEKLAIKQVSAYSKTMTGIEGIIEATMLWNSNRLQVESVHPTCRERANGKPTSVANRGRVRVVLLPWTLTKEKRDRILQQAKERRDGRIEKSSKKIEAEETLKIKQPGGNKEEKKAERDTRAMRENELDRRIRSKKAKDEARIWEEETERLEDDLSLFDNEAGLFGQFGYTTDPAISNDRSSISYTVLLDSGTKVRVPSKWIVLEWELQARARPFSAAIADISQKKDVDIREGGGSGGSGGGIAAKGTKGAERRGRRKEDRGDPWAEEERDGVRDAFGFMGNLFGQDKTKVEKDAVKDQLLSIMEARRAKAVANAKENSASAEAEEALRERMKERELIIKQSRVRIFERIEKESAEIRAALIDSFRESKHVKALNLEEKKTEETKEKEKNLSYFDKIEAEKADAAKKRADDIQLNRKIKAKQDQNTARIEEDEELRLEAELFSFDNEED